MTHRIFHVKDDKSLEELTEQPYDAESLLQELIAKYPNLLGGGEGDRRWLLIKKEIGVPFESGGENRWSLDHLFVDQDAIPTLVEVKRISDTRIRREVVGQMLDYAANAVLFWPVERLEAEFQITAEKQGRDSDSILQEFLQNEMEPTQFWSLVRTNLQANKIRLVFVSDEIPNELRRIVEFLNQQMNPAEVLALEVKQFVGGKTRSLVPRLIGKTSGADVRKSSGVQKRLWNEDSFFQVLKERSNKEFEVAHRIYEWAIAKNLRIAWGQGATDGAFFVMLDYGDKIGIYTVAVRQGWKAAYVQFQFGQMTEPPFDKIEGRQELATYLKKATNFALSEDALNKYPSIRLLELVESKRLEGFLSFLDWVVDKYKGTLS